MHAVHTRCCYWQVGYCLLLVLLCYRTAVAPIDVPLSKVVFFWCGKFYPPVWYVASSPVEEVLYVAIGHWADRKSTVRTMTVADQYLPACVDIQSWSFVSVCVWKSRLGARRVCTECVKGWEINVLPETLWGRLWGAVFRVCQNDLSSMRVWPTSRYNDASFRIQIHALKKSGTTSSELCHAFAFKTKGKRRLWRTNGPLMFQRDRDNTRNMSAPRAFQTHCWAIAIDQFKEYGLTTPSAALQSGLQESFIATKRETTSSSHELNQGRPLKTAPA